jgi:hypothetical protein
VVAGDRRLAGQACLISLTEVAELQRKRTGLTAAAGPPLLPSREWFEMRTGSTYPADDYSRGPGVRARRRCGGTRHTGRSGSELPPPKSRSGYSFFETGATEVQEGDLIPTGRITLGTGHASLTASPTAVAEHYDNTGSVLADVRASDGKVRRLDRGRAPPECQPTGHG